MPVIIDFLTDVGSKEEAFIQNDSIIQDHRQ